MTQKAGVWINHRRAVVVLNSSGAQELKEFTAGLGRSVRASDQTPPKKKYTRSDFVADDRLERKATAKRLEFYEDIRGCLKGVGTILILGPGKATGEFVKYLARKKHRGTIVELETADRLTNRQIAAKVNEHLTMPPLRMSSAPRLGVKSPSRKRAKKGSKKAD